MARLSADFCYQDGEETFEEAVAHFTQGLNVSHKVLQEHGPAGGWPVVEWSGSREDLTELCKRYMRGTVVTSDPERNAREEAEGARQLATEIED